MVCSERCDGATAEWTRHPSRDLYVIERLAVPDRAGARLRPPLSGERRSGQTPLRAGPLRQVRRQAQDLDILAQVLALLFFPSSFLFDLTSFKSLFFRFRVLNYQCIFQNFYPPLKISGYRPDV